MNLKFVVNDYLLIWNLLFKDSITQDICNLKQKLWNTYEKEYNEIYKDKELILEDSKNFIPNNDLIYNFIIDSKDFENIKKEVEKVRFSVVKNYDKNIKHINKLIKKVIRKEMPNYECFILNTQFNIHETIKLNNKEGRIIIGKQKETENNKLTELLFDIIKQEIVIENEDDLGIKDAILELAVLNEFQTDINGYSCYQNGTASLQKLKKFIYPYWLMYLGIQRKDMLEYMERDKIYFEVNNYAYEKELINMNIEEFISFVIRNKRYIIRTNVVKETDEII